MTAKRAVKTVFRLLMLPIYGAFCLLTLFGNTDSVFQGFSQALSLIPGKIGTYCRAAFYSLACPGTSDEISIGFLTLLSHQDTTIERGVYIGPQCNIGKCTIGEDTLIGSGVHILSGNRQHHFDDPDTPIQQQGGTYEKVTIRPDCWLGNGCLVMATVPAQTIIAAGSVVTRSPNGSGGIVAGNPAELVKQRIKTRN
ncbi:transferase family hexapeptide repeat protein [Tamilnaduibacter salinus]|uniref:Transferase family hexapeptide repeat protein n=2 Tax=Tamilnaduibacter salinus TaxID=1484056 RepID=A0A2U1D053_9GAMM|nr:transferase family hexapeptide repeat protein [Tamilnaduibacter salinus]